MLILLRIKNENCGIACRWRCCNWEKRCDSIFHNTSKAITVIVKKKYRYEAIKQRTNQNSKSKRRL